MPFTVTFRPIEVDDSLADIPAEAVLIAQKRIANAASGIVADVAYTTLTQVSYSIAGAIMDVSAKSLDPLEDDRD